MKMAPNEQERGREKAKGEWGTASMCMCVKVGHQPVGEGEKMLEKM